MTLSLESQIRARVAGVGSAVLMSCWRQRLGAEQKRVSLDEAKGRGQLLYTGRWRLSERFNEEGVSTGFPCPDLGGGMDFDE